MRTVRVEILRSTVAWRVRASFHASAALAASCSRASISAWTCSIVFVGAAEAGAPPSTTPLMTTASAASGATIRAMRTRRSRAVVVVATKAASLSHPVYQVS